jgi:hypothetical protein
MKKTLLEAAAGIAGGLLGTLLLQQLTRLGGKLPSRFQPRMHRDPADVALGGAERLARRRLDEQRRKRIKPFLPFVYGVSGPLVLGLTARRLGRGSFARVVAAGTAMGAIVWAAGHLGWMPAAGVMPPIHRQRVEATAQSLLGHTLYGAVSALPVALVERYV